MTYNVFGGTLSLTQSINQLWSPSIVTEYSTELTITDDDDDYDDDDDIMHVLVQQPAQSGGDNETALRATHL